MYDKPGCIVNLEFDLMEMQELEMALYNQWRTAVKRIMYWREKAETGGEGVNVQGCWQAAQATENYADRVWDLCHKITTGKLLSEGDEDIHNLKDWDLPDYLPNPEEVN